MSFDAADLYVADHLLNVVRTISSIDWPLNHVITRIIHARVDRSCSVLIQLLLLLLLT